MKTETHPRHQRAASKRKRVLLVDKFAFSRATASNWLQETPDLAICGEADSESGAFDAIERLNPDAVVTEVFCEQDLEFIRRMHQLHPSLPILVYSFRQEECYAPLALEAGANGYVMKGARSADLVEGIRGALEGRLVLSRQIRAQLLAKCVRSRRCQASGGSHENWRSRN